MNIVRDYICDLSTGYKNNTIPFKEESIRSVTQISMDIDKQLDNLREKTGYSKVHIMRLAIYKFMKELQTIENNGGIK